MEHADDESGQEDEIHEPNAHEQDMASWLRALKVMRSDPAWAVEFLDEYSAPDMQDINFAAPDTLGCTLLHVAAMGRPDVPGDIAMVRVLLKHGADPTLEDAAGRTPLHCAALNGHTEIGKLLIDAGARVDAFQDNVPVHRASDSPVVGQMRTPLMLASYSGKAEMVRFLLKHGAWCFVDASDQWPIPPGDHNPAVYDEVRTILRRLRNAGSYEAYVEAYVIAPRLHLLALGRLCAQGRASPLTGCPPILQRLFPSTAGRTSGKRTRSARLADSANRTALPEDVLSRVLEYML